MYICNLKLVKVLIFKHWNLVFAVNSLLIVHRLSLTFPTLQLHTHTHVHILCTFLWKQNLLFTSICLWNEVFTIYTLLLDEVVYSPEVTSLLREACNGHYVSKIRLIRVISCKWLSVCACPCMYVYCICYGCSMCMYDIALYTFYYQQKPSPRSSPAPSAQPRPVAASTVPETAPSAPSIYSTLNTELVSTYFYPVHIYTALIIR